MEPTRVILEDEIQELRLSMKTFSFNNSNQNHQLIDSSRQLETHLKELWRSRLLSRIILKTNLLSKWMYQLESHCLTRDPAIKATKTVTLTEDLIREGDLKL